MKKDVDTVDVKFPFKKIRLKLGQNVCYHRSSYIFRGVTMCNNAPYIHYNRFFRGGLD
jgi:hypothetical protein